MLELIPQFVDLENIISNLRQLNYKGTCWNAESETIQKFKIFFNSIKQDRLNIQAYVIPRIKNSNFLPEFDDQFLNNF